MERKNDASAMMDIEHASQRKNESSGKEQ